MKSLRVKLCGLFAGAMALGGAAIAPGAVSPACAGGYCPPYCQCIFDASGNPILCSHEDCFDCRG